MKRIDQMWAYDVMVEGFPVVKFYDAVHDTLKQGQWYIGQPETMPELQAWLTPDGKGRIPLGAFTAVAISYYKEKYPLAADHNIAIAASVLRWAVTGARDSLCLSIRRTIRCLNTV